MNWYRVLVEASGRYRSDQPSNGHVGLFTTRNVSAADETSARQAAIRALRAELTDIEREGSSPSSISVVSIRPLTGSADFGAGFTFHDNRGDARESALSLEQRVYEQDPVSHNSWLFEQLLSVVRRLTRRWS